jgi:hypothetical protein
MPVLPANMTCPPKDPTETKQKVVKTSKAKAAQDAKVEKSKKKPKPPAKVKGKGKKLLPPNGDEKILMMWSEDWTIRKAYCN